MSLIETGSVKNTGIQTHAIGHKGMSLFSPGAWLGRISFFRDSLQKKIKGNEFQLDIKLLNRILMVGVSLLAIYFFTSVYFGVISITKLPTLKFSAQGAKEEAASLQNMSVLKNAMSYYMEKIQQRDIFKIGARPAPQKASSPKEPTPRIIEETQRFKLVGISWSKDPDAMIEDTVALRTFFVKRGQMLGRVKVEGIFKDKVILSYEGEEAELR
ncbi:MAG: hypothetical protein HZA30_03465 [Candidatus Omnitrophica bacterium]|nr:hypothetical protein [Candidatus Omnitrophota bacterium]